MAGALQVFGLQEHPKTSHTQKGTGHKEGGPTVNKERTNKAGRTFDRAWAILAALVALSILTCKVSGRLAWSWLGVALGYAWIMCSLVAAYVLLAVLARGLCWAIKRGREQKRRRKLARTLNEAMEGLTLNSVGPIYGVRRKPGEKNRDFKRRILKAVQTVQTVYLSINGAGGRVLDEIARQHGLQRNTGENDEKLRSRIIKAAGKPKGGKTNGL